MDAKFKRPMSTKRRPVFKTKQYGNPNKSNNCSRSVNNTTKKKAFTNQTLRSNNRQLAASLNFHKLSLAKLQEKINELNGEILELRRELVEAKRISSESSCSCNANMEAEYQKRLVEFLKPLKSCLHAAVDAIQPLSENLGIALNITSAPERRSKSLGAINFREDRLQMKRQVSKHDGQINNVSGNDGIPSVPHTDRSDIEQSNATLEISPHDGNDVHVTRRRPSKDLPNNSLSNSDLGFDFPTVVEKSRSSKYGKNEESAKRKEQKIDQNPSSETPAGLIRPRRIGRENVSYAENSPVSERPKRKASSNKSYKEPLLSKKLRQNKRDIK